MWIRIGTPPYSGLSGIYKGEERIGFEKGLSVYYATYFDGEWHIVLPTPVTESTLSTLYQLRLRVLNGTDVYLMKGKQIGIGTDNEPLIADYEVVRRIENVMV